MIDIVLTHPHPPMTCGVAKFSHQLAGQLGVPCRAFGRHPFRHPLISIKSTEFQSSQTEWPLTAMWYENYDLFLHDGGHGLCRDDALRGAHRVYAGNAVIANELRAVRPDVVEAFCPATVTGNPSRGTYRVLAFGMASKLHLDRFRSLKTELEEQYPNYTIGLSTAVHEGSPWDEGLTQATEGMRAIFGDRLRVLGFLGDDALAKELIECDAVAAYFTPALRANNTSAWAALAYGKKLYTNTDEYSPALDPAAHSWPKLIEMINA